MWTRASWVSVTCNQKSPDEDTLMSRGEKQLCTSTRKPHFILLGSAAQLPHPRLRGNGPLCIALIVPSPALNVCALPVHAIITLG